jgi:hypothetical protein
MSDQTRLNWVAPRVRIAIKKALPLDPRKRCPGGTLLR